MRRQKNQPEPKRFLLAMFLSGTMLFGWQYFFLQPPPETPGVPAEQPAKTQATPTPDAKPNPMVVPQPAKNVPLRTDVEEDTRGVEVNVDEPESKLAVFDARGHFVSFVPNDSADGWKRPTHCIVLKDLRAIELGSGSMAPCYPEPTRTMLYFEQPGCAGEPISNTWLPIVNFRGQLYRKSDQRVSYMTHSILVDKCIDLPKPTRHNDGYRLRRMDSSELILPNPPYEVRKVGAEWSPIGYGTSPD